MTDDHLTPAEVQSALGCSEFEAKLYAGWANRKGDQNRVDFMREMMAAKAAPSPSEEV